MASSEKVQTIKNLPCDKFLFSFFNRIPELADAFFLHGVDKVWSGDKSSVADAKYIPLKEQRTYVEEKATAIYYKTIAYMYRFCTDKGYLFFPHPDEEAKPEVLDLLSEVDGVNGGTITKLGLRIPSGCDSFSNFIVRMEQNESSFLSHL